MSLILGKEGCYQWVGEDREVEDAYIPSAKPAMIWNTLHFDVIRRSGGKGQAYAVYDSFFSRHARPVHESSEQKQAAHDVVLGEIRRRDNRDMI
jgi:hypothetical protein